MLTRAGHTTGPTLPVAFGSLAMGLLGLKPRLPAPALGLPVPEHLLPWGCSATPCPSLLINLSLFLFSLNKPLLLKSHLGGWMAPGTLCRIGFQREKQKIKARAHDSNLTRPLEENCISVLGTSCSAPPLLLQPRSLPSTLGSIFICLSEVLPPMSPADSLPLDKLPLFHEGGREATEAFLT